MLSRRHLQISSAVSAFCFCLVPRMKCGSWKSHVRAGHSLSDSLVRWSKVNIVIKECRTKMKQLVAVKCKRMHNRTKMPVKAIVKQRQLAVHSDGHSQVFSWYALHTSGGIHLPTRMQCYSLEHWEVLLPLSGECEWDLVEFWPSSNHNFCYWCDVYVVLVRAYPPPFSFSAEEELTCFHFWSPDSSGRRVYMWLRTGLRPMPLQSMYQ